MDFTGFHKDNLLRKAVLELENTNIEEFVLQNKTFSTDEIQYIATQIHCRKKAKHKLPDWYQNLNVLFPDKTSIEQCSSQATATYKSSLFSGCHLLDLTGGLGVDTYYFSFQFQSVTYVEKHEPYYRAALNNFSALKRSNICCINYSAEKFLQTISQNQFDTIYIDPSRRYHNNRVIRLEDCSPNVITLMPLLFHKSPSVLIKTSPLVDIKHTLQILSNVSDIYVISVKNECKEVLFKITSSCFSEPLVHAVCMNNDIKQTFSFTFSEEKFSEVKYSDPLTYLYEPDAALLKAGAFKWLSQKYALFKLHTHTHLYTSLTLVPHFPGRIFKVLHVLKYSKKEVHQTVKHSKANVAVRNFPDSVSQVRKKLALDEGGDIYLFATTDMHDKHIILHTEKIS
ncbi:MAG: class I SAM-dependent methyltransferase [Cytophagaceae bacterium]|nr:class I SAM-dependent methyltransferase [Cytophagaceae bacterium]MDW8455458.1 hypothetical protein [Cytophagaceae bacterium]